jgi:hypothetical protein
MSNDKTFYQENEDVSQVVAVCERIGNYCLIGEWVANGG